MQTLKRLICLCTGCHTVTYFGYAQVRGLETQAFAHLVKVTGMSPDQARRHVGAAFCLSSPPWWLPPRRCRGATTTPARAA